jgi:succinoglycan biosynthesis transport protein ExoP
MRALLEEASQNYDYIIVDLPPIRPVVDVRASASLFDKFLFCIEWGATPIETVQIALSRDDQIRKKCLGVILNKADPETQKLYDRHASSGYYESRYATPISS